MKDGFFWVFGYGSLVWDPGLEVDEKVIGFIKGYRRVFYLACIDHRGTPENPARTCPLEEYGAICREYYLSFSGALHIVCGEGQKQKRMPWSIWNEENANMMGKLWRTFSKFTSTPDKKSNKYYLGPAPLDDMAKQIATAFGPCGNNRDYIFSLEKALFDMGNEDEYVIELANEVRKVLGIVDSGIEEDKKLSSPSQVKYVTHQIEPIA